MDEPTPILRADATDDDLGDEVPYMLERSGAVPKGDSPHPDMDPPPPEPTLSELAANKLPGSGIVVPPPKATRQEAVVIEGVFHGMRDVEE